MTSFSDLHETLLAEMEKKIQEIYIAAGAKLEVCMCVSEIACNKYTSTRIPIQHGPHCSFGLRLM